MGDSKFASMFKLMSNDSLKFKSDYADDLKCHICKNILINACQTRCGCTFCRKCIDNLLEKGKKWCPGNSAECKVEDLSEGANIQIDHKANKRISQLLVSCADKMCSYECELISMEDHFRLCSKRNSKCQFGELGCDHSTNADHDQLLADIIINLRNEISCMQQYKHDIKKDIEALQKQTNKEMDKFNLYSDQLKFVQLENNQLKNNVEHLTKMLTNETNSFDSKIDNLKANLKRENNNLQMALSQELETRVLELNKACLQKKEFNQFRQEINEKLKKLNSNKGLEHEISQIRGIIGENEKQMGELQYMVKELQRQTNTQSHKLHTKLNEVKKLSATKLTRGAPLISWDIDNVTIKRRDSLSISSEFFSSPASKYRMQLCSYLNGYGDGEFSSLTVYLYVWIDANVSWPFRGEVTIQIINQYRSDVSKFQEKYCEISKPLLYGWSSPFHFKYDLLTTEGLLTRDTFTVQCFIQNK